MKKFPVYILPSWSDSIPAEFRANGIGRLHAGHEFYNANTDTADVESMAADALAAAKADEPICYCKFEYAGAGTCPWLSDWNTGKVLNDDEARAGRLKAAATLDAIRERIAPTKARIGIYPAAPRIHWGEYLWGEGYSKVYANERKEDVLWRHVDVSYPQCYRFHPGDLTAWQTATRYQVRLCASKSTIVLIRTEYAPDSPVNDQDKPIPLHELAAMLRYVYGLPCEGVALVTDVRERHEWWETVFEFVDGVDAGTIG